MFVKTDGGRAEAGYRARVADCAVRAIAIAAELPYKQVYRQLNLYCQSFANCDVRYGTPDTVLHRYLKSLGWEYVPAKRYGKHTNMHLNATELPSGRIIASIKNHVTAVIDGVIHDSWDPSKEGEEPVLGYWVAK